MEEYGHKLSRCDYDAYLCSVLKDYPEMITEAVTELLLEIKFRKKRIY